MGDRWISKQLALRDAPSVAVVGPLYGAYFFASRSIDTALIASLAVVLVGWLYVRAVRPTPLPAAEADGAPVPEPVALPGPERVAPRRSGR
jgi:hypothetical protein